MQVLEHFKRVKYTGASYHLSLTTILAIIVSVILVMQWPKGMALSSIALYMTSAALFCICVRFSMPIFNKVKSFYFVFQGALIVLQVVAIPNSSILTLISFGAILVVHSFYFYNRMREFIVYLLSYLTFGAIILYASFGIERLDFYLLIFVLSLIIVFLVLSIFNQKELENIALQESNEKIELLTRQNERQRMARDLHDSLIQKLIALNLKMDVIDVHMQKANYNKASEIIHIAKQQVGESIIEARKVVEDLRLNTDSLTLQEKLFEEIQSLKYAYYFDIRLRVHVITEPSQPLSDNMISIIKEALTNVHKHAKAQRVAIQITEQSDAYTLSICDDGIGINIEHALQLEKHYGLVGMQERVALFDGDFQLENKNGTIITIAFPLERNLLS